MRHRILCTGRVVGRNRPCRSVLPLANQRHHLLSLPLQWQSVQGVTTTTIKSHKLAAETSFTPRPECGGCGVQMQAQSPEAPGFCPPEVLGRILQPIGSDVVCQRCYSLAHYGRDVPMVLPAERYERELKQLRRAPGLVLQVLDATDLSASFNPRRFDAVIGDHSTIVVVNKVDLLPKGANFDRIERWMWQSAEAAGVKGLRDVCLLSGKTGFGVRDLLLSLAEHHQGRPIYCVGYANAGKSRLLQQLVATAEALPALLPSFLNDMAKAGRTAAAPHQPRLHHAVAPSRGTTVSPVPGTTLHLVSVRLPGDSGLTLIDTPGLLPDFNIAAALPPPLLRAFINPARFKPVTYTLLPGEAIGLSSLATIELLEGPEAQVTCFLPPLALLRRGAADRIKATMQQDISENEEVVLAELEMRRSDLHIDGSKVQRGVAAADVALAGLGWVAISGAGKMALRVEAPAAMRVLKRSRPLLPFEGQAPTKYFGSAQQSQMQRSRPKKKKGSMRIDNLAIKRSKRRQSRNDKVA